jgi:predicted RNA-binding protein with TRAM domain
MQIYKRFLSVLFGSIFLGVGVFLMWQTTGTTLVNWQGMQSWQSSQARLLTVSGDTSKATARYRYVVAGVSYESERVYVAQFNDNIGDYQEKLQQRLSSIFDDRQVISIWINPHNPSESVIDRNMRWGLFVLMMVFCSVFVLIGLLVVIFSFKSHKKSTQERVPNFTGLRREWEAVSTDVNNKETFVEYRQRKIKESKRHSQNTKNTQSWQTRKGWQAASIRSNARNRLWLTWGGALLATVIIAPMAVNLFDEMYKGITSGNYLTLLVLLFPLVAILLIYQAIKATLEYRRFGKVLFNMDPYPGAIGGHVGGKILVPKLAYDIVNAQASECSVRLECVYSTVSGSGDDRRRSESILWAQQGAPKVARLGKGVSFSFRFDTPEHLPSSDVVQKETYNFWRLTVKVNIKGIDLNREYNIPVFKDVDDSKTSRHVRHDVSAQQEKQTSLAASITRHVIEQGDFNVEGLSRAMRTKKKEGELHLAFPMFRNKILIMFLAIFSGGFGFASLSIIMSALGGGVMGIVMWVFSVPFLCVAIISTIAFVYVAFNNLRVNIKAGSVTVLRRLLFIPILKRQLHSDDIASLSIKRTGSTGSGVDEVEHFNILVHDKKGKKVTLAEDIDGEVAAESFKEYLHTRLI